MSRSRIRRLFTRLSGEPPLAYLQQHRLRLATQCLRNRGFGIQQIAYLVGYSVRRLVKVLKNSLKQSADPDTRLESSEEPVLTTRLKLLD